MFDEVWRVLKPKGTCWVNLGDTYGTQSGGMREGKVHRNTSFEGQLHQPKSIHKCLLQIPSRFALAMVDNGWILRNEIIWFKRNAMPCSVKDRFTVDFEKLYFFTKNTRYYFTQQREPLSSGSDSLGRNNRCVWDVPTKPLKCKHRAAFPEQLIETPIRAGCPENGIVLDPFMGSGTTAIVAQRLGRRYLGIELNPDYVKLAEKRIDETRASNGRHSALSNLKDAA